MTGEITLVLETGLFGDTGTVREAATELEDVRIVEIKPNEMNEGDWDRLLDEVLGAEKVIAI